jgi:hypothetical protein
MWLDLSAAVATYTWSNDAAQSLQGQVDLRDLAINHRPSSEAARRDY